MREVPAHLKSIIIGDFSINLTANGEIEFRTFNDTAKTTLTRDEARELLQWLNEQKEYAMTDNQEMTDLYGPAASFAEHRVGDRIRYTDTEHPKATGTIIWISAPTAKRAMQYVVEPDRGGFPDFIAPGDVIAVM